MLALMANSMNRMAWKEAEKKEKFRQWEEKVLWSSTCQHQRNLTMVNILNNNMCMCDVTKSVINLCLKEIAETCCCMRKDKIRFNAEILEIQ